MSREEPRFQLCRESQTAVLFPVESLTTAGRSQLQPPEQASGSWERLTKLLV